MVKIVKLPDVEQTTYQIETIADLMEVVTVENVETLKADVAGFLDYVIMTRNNEAIKSLGGKVITKPFILWTDDNVAGLKKIIMTFETKEGAN